MNRGNALVAASYHFIKVFLAYQMVVAFKRRAIDIDFMSSLAFSSSVSTFMLLNRMLRYLDITKKTKLAISGSLSSMLLLLMDKSFLSIKMILYILLQLLFKYFPKNRVFTKDMLAISLMCISASRILGSFLSDKDKYLDKNYRRFLDKQSGQPIDMIKRFRRGDVPYGQVLKLLNGDVLTHINYPYYINYVKVTFMRALKLYTKVYTFVLISNGFSNPLKTVVSNFRSSLFLFSYVTIGWISLYLNSLLCKASTPVSYCRLLLHMWSAGLSVLIEPKHKRPSLAIYCSVFAFESLYNEYIRCRSTIDQENNDDNNGWYIDLAERVFYIASLTVYIIHYKSLIPSIVNKHLLDLK